MALPAHHDHWIDEEAAMAAIAFNTAQRAAGRFEAVLIAVGEKIDPSVNYQMWLAAAEAERARTPPDDELASTATPFRPLDASIVSDAIPAFFIGRNKDGFWIARDAKGRIGGIFLLENSALSFAKRHSQPGGCATIFPSHRFELDLENNGNPLALQLGSLMRLRRRVAAFIVEPVQGEGGFYIAPPAFIEGLKRIADEHGILLIADEVQTGAGRTGTWYACEQWPVAPDLIAAAKSLAGGFPLSGVTGRAEVMDAPGAGGLGGTYAGSPIGCAAALAVIQAFEDERLLERARVLGQTLMRGLHRIAERVPAIRDVRGLGAMVAIELFENGDLARPDAELTRRVVAEAARRGLILLSCGSYGNVIRVLVPLTAPDAVIAEGLQILADSFAAMS